MSVYNVDDLSKVRFNPSGEGRFNACQTKWALHTLLGVDKRRGPTTDDRDRGKAMHSFAEHYVRHYAATGDLAAFDGEAGEDAAREVFETLHSEEGIDFEEQACHDMLAAARANLPLIGLEDFKVVHVDGVPLIELDIHATVEGVQFQAIVDAVLRHKATSKIWVPDWKTTKAAINTSNSLNYTEQNSQLALQCLVLEGRYGIEADYSALCQIRSIAPQPPPQTSRKKLTRDLSKLACDAQTYFDALVANGEDPYEEKTAAKLRQLKHCVFVRWLPDIAGPEARAEMRAELIRKGQQAMSIARGESMPLRARRNVTGHEPYNRGCTGCDYDKWCLAEIRNGGVPDFGLVGVDYVRNDKATFETVKGRTPTPASEAYAEFSREYGKERLPTEAFTP